MSGGHYGRRVTDKTPGKGKADDLDMAWNQYDTAKATVSVTDHIHCRFSSM